MVKIKLHDYYDEWLWCFCGVGMGNNAASVIVPQIEAAVEAGEDIEVDIKSGGGYVHDGFAIYNALLAAGEKVKVTTINNAIAASIASIVFMAGSDRKMYKASQLMVHKPTIDPFWYGSMDAEDLKKEAAALDSIQAILASIYVDSSGIDLGIVNDMINAETWLNPSECETFGFSTETIGTKMVKVDVMEEVMNNLYKKAPANVRAFANNAFNSVKTNTNIMNNKEATDTLKETQSLLTRISNKFFPKPKNSTTVLKNGDSIYHDGDLAVGVSVFSDEAMTTELADGSYELSDDSTFTVASGAVTEMTEAPEDAAEDAEDAATVEALEARVAILEAENIALTAQRNELVTSLKSVNKVMAKAATVSSSFKVPGRVEDFGDKDKDKDEDKPARFSNVKKPIKKAK